jgi:hypothetical protein
MKVVTAQGAREKRRFGDGKLTVLLSITACSLVAPQRGVAHGLDARTEDRRAVRPGASDVRSSGRCVRRWVARVRCAATGSDGDQLAG